MMTGIIGVFALFGAIATLSAGPWPSFVNFALCVVGVLGFAAAGTAISEGGDHVR